MEPYDSSGPGRPPAQACVVALAAPGGQRTVTAVSAGAGARGTAVPDGRVRATPVASRAATTTPTAVGTWTAVVAADRAYYDSVRAVSDQDAASISLPAHVPERRFRLSGTEVRIGRRSVSRRIEPEIDLTGPPTDPGVSRLHAVLIAGPDRSWSVVDPGSPNGILVNGKDVPPGEAAPARRRPHPPGRVDRDHHHPRLTRPSGIVPRRGWLCRHPERPQRRERNPEGSRPWSVRRRTTMPAAQAPAPEGSPSALTSWVREVTPSLRNTLRRW